MQNFHFPAMYKPNLLYIHDRNNGSKVSVNLSGDKDLGMVKNNEKFTI